jgi:predicted deacylase
MTVWSDLPGFSVRPGSLQSGGIAIGSDRDASPVQLPLLVAQGTHEGPTIYVGALIHGIELGGWEVVRRLMREVLNPEELSGTILAIPMQNPMAFRTSSYHTLDDGLNANRIFPGDPDETLTNRAVAAISKYAVAPAEYVIDVHCNVQNSVVYNFVRIDGTEVGERSLELSQAFGFTTVVSQLKRHGFGFEERLTGLLADYALNAGKPSLTV